MRAWLAESDVVLVVMEATGVYSKPVWYALEELAGVEVMLVNARHVKNLPGPRLRDEHYRPQLEIPEPAANVLLPAIRPSKQRKSVSIEQAQRLLIDAIPADSRPAMWLTGLMCGLRPRELSGLRWPYIDIDSPEASIEIAERAFEPDTTPTTRHISVTDRSQSGSPSSALNVYTMVTRSWPLVRLAPSSTTVHPHRSKTG